jgi:oligoendopeptidase F
MAASLTLPARRNVKASDTWDLSVLFDSDESWHEALKTLEKKAKGYSQFEGTLSKGPEQLAKCLKYDSSVERLAERLGNYAYLKTTEDQANGIYQGMMARFQNIAVKASEAASFIQPEIIGISDSKFAEFIKSPKLARFRLTLDRMRRYKKYTLSRREEQLLAMQGEMASVSNKVFRQLLDSDLKFGTVKDENGTEVQLTNSTFQQLLVSPKRQVRKTAFHKYYEQFKSHENTLAATLCGSVQKDVYYARARGYSSALHQALFSDNVPLSVYENLISVVHNRLPSVYRYYELRRKKMKLKEIHHYDTYVPILNKIKSRYSWNEAVNTVIDSLSPLGAEYCNTLKKGLNGRWCDRYANQNKQSGAFSYGTYDGVPYILMNYKADVLNDLFTLTHEAGHSMHTYFSVNSQPFEYYNYTIFVAEVASTFNEQLLTDHLFKHAKDDLQRTYLINNEIDGIRATIVRQTMFAEFEKITHQMSEAGEPITVDSFKQEYQKLLKLYFGPEFNLDDELKMECFRIPHFYRAFYVYKYATGLSAAIALSQRVLKGGQKELAQYHGFLKSGCSQYPLDLLRDAGVDLETPEPVETALDRFDELLSMLEQML